MLATGESGLDEAGKSFAIDLGVTWLGANPFNPDYFKPHFELPNMGNGEFVCYSRGQSVQLSGGTELGIRVDPYFNRSWDAYYFTHAPDSRNNAGPGMVESVNGIYFAWHAFADYGENGSTFMKECILYALNRL
ncbi:MAG: hypothetical protein K0R28_6258, partial [Paenibacillus sp.]|nr:hypothetical protein [Paenibacillus sp.]